MADPKVDHTRYHREELSDQLIALLPRGQNKSAYPGSRIPHPDPHCLLFWLIPQTSDSHKRRTDRTFNQTQEEALSDKAGVVGTCDGTDADDAPDGDDGGTGGREGQAGEEQGHGEHGNDVAIIELLISSLAIV